MHLKCATHARVSAPAGGGHAGGDNPGGRRGEEELRGRQDDLRWGRVFNRKSSFTRGNPTSCLLFQSKVPNEIGISIAIRNTCIGGAIAVVYSLLRLSPVRGVVPPNAKQSATFQYKIIVFQGQFHIISAFSIEYSKCIYTAIRYRQDLQSWRPQRSSSRRLRHHFK